MPYAPSGSNKNKPTNQTNHTHGYDYMHIIFYYNIILVLVARIKELHNLYASLNIIRMIKSKRMR
jgi:hypothetical protein